MTWIEVRITDSKGSLVDEFETNSPDVADRRIADWQAKFQCFEPDEVLTVRRSDRCQTAGHEDRPATVSLRLPAMDDWPASPNVCSDCAGNAMYPLAVKADRALRAEHQRLRDTGLTDDEINARLHPGMVEVLSRARQAGGTR